jgi:hypothetical protein
MLSAVLLLSALALGEVADPSPIVPDPSPVATAAPAVKQSLTVAPQHTHRCPRCGTEWSHGHSSFGNVAEHTCPNCGTLNWQVHRQGAANPLPSIGPFVVPRSSSSCPGGVCPTPASRRGFFGW